MWTTLLKYSYLILLFLPLAMTFAQEEDEDLIPDGEFKTPYDVVYNHFYYLQDVNGIYDPTRAAVSFVTDKDIQKVVKELDKNKKKKNKKKNKKNFINVIREEFEKIAAKQISPNQEKKLTKGEELAIQLKQILDGKGLQVRVGLIPENADHLDSSSKKHVYVLFPQRLPEVYLERVPINDEQTEFVWVYSKETIKMIPKLHQQVYPFGSHKLLTLLPKFGTASFLGLKVWQYISILILALIATIIHFVISRLLNIFIQFLANTRLGRDHFDKDIVKRIAKILSYLVVTYVVYLFTPVLQLPPALSYYIITGLRILTTIYIIFLALRIIELGNSYFEQIVAETEKTTDDQLLPIVVRSLKFIVWIAGGMQILSAVGVNVTALIAGLSIGGLAIALAAQETVKSLIGSAMIYADKPFQVGDFISTGTIVGTVVEVGFRSTRIRTPDTSIITVPNGSLADMVVDNLGAREFRRFNTSITIAYHTPPDLIEKFIHGLREIKRLHPKTLADPFYIHLNGLAASSIDILFVVYFATDNYDDELVFKEEIIFSILRLAEALGVQMAYPSTSVYVETMPGNSGGSAIPKYRTDKKEVDASMNAFFEDFRKRYPLPEGYEDQYLEELRSGGQE
ncbi:MAG: mechanosensitive ion channel family protein [Saprospiraceae bacterium]|nr:mechanosensitive ion channel family protein [Saprospiraceae bacterium]